MYLRFIFVLCPFFQEQRARTFTCVFCLFYACSFRNKDEHVALAFYVCLCLFLREQSLALAFTCVFVRFMPAPPGKKMSTLRLRFMFVLCCLSLQEQRGAAIGFFNWGIYVGYSLTFVFLIAVRQLGWRYVYFIAGAPGFIFAALILFTVKEKTRKEAAVVVKVSTFRLS